MNKYILTIKMMIYHEQHKVKHILLTAVGMNLSAFDVNLT